MKNYNVITVTARVAMVCGGQPHFTVVPVFNDKPATAAECWDVQFADVREVRYETTQRHTPKGPIFEHTQHVEKRGGEKMTIKRGDLVRITGAVYSYEVFPSVFYGINAADVEKIEEEEPTTEQTRTTKFVTCANWPNKCATWRVHPSMTDCEGCEHYEKEGGAK